MATIPVMYQQLDSMVLDYIDRRPEGLLRDKIIKINAATKHCGTGVTLEEIYCFYFREKALPTTFLADKMETYANSSVCKTKTTLPGLPIEVIDHILRFCPVETLLTFRVLSRSLSVLSCEQLRKCYRKIVDLRSTGCIDKFLSTFQNGVLNFGCPLGMYMIGLSSLGTLRIIDLVGAEMTFLQLDLKNNVLPILDKVPNIEVLITEADPITQDFESLKVPPLRALRSLKLYPSIHPSKVSAFLEYLKNWLEIAPNLAEVSFRKSGLIDSVPDLLEFVRTNRRLRKLTFEDYIVQIDANGKVSIELHLVPLHLRSTTVLSYDSFIAQTSSILTRLEISEHQMHTIPCLPNLTRLKVDTCDPSPQGSRILPDNFPALKHVTLDHPILHNFSQTYQHTVFETVESLSLHDICWIGSFDLLPKFHIIFPRVTNLSLGGCPNKIYTDYFSNNFQRISTLNLYAFPSTLTSMAQGYTVQRREEVGVQWPFSKLKNVKNMEFEPNEAVRPLVNDLLNLTLKKCLPPLEILTVTFKPKLLQRQIQEIKVDDAITLFYSMESLRYHKRLKFNHDTLI